MDAPRHMQHAAVWQMVMFSCTAGRKISSMKRQRSVLCSRLATKSAVWSMLSTINPLRLHN